MKKDISIILFIFLVLGIVLSGLLGYPIYIKEKDYKEIYQISLEVNQEITEFFEMFLDFTEKERKLYFEEKKDMPLQKMLQQYYDAITTIGEGKYYISEGNYYWDSLQNIESTQSFLQSLRSYYLSAKAEGIVKNSDLAVAIAEGSMVEGRELIILREYRSILTRLKLMEYYSPSRFYFTLDTKTPVDMIYSIIPANIKEKIWRLEKALVEDDILKNEINYCNIMIDFTENLQTSIENDTYQNFFCNLEKNSILKELSYCLEKQIRLQKSFKIQIGEIKIEDMIYEIRQIERMQALAQKDDCSEKEVALMKKYGENMCRKLEYLNTFEQNLQNKNR